MNIAIIAAAGSGQRFDATRPKQFVELLGKPLIIYSLEAFEACSAIDEIVLVLSEDGRGLFESIRPNYRLQKLKSIVTGGQTRAESVRNGIDVIDGSADDIVAVHDGARPLVSIDDITRTVERAGEIGAACLVADVTDTIKEVDGDFIAGTIDRTRLRRALTPQAFRLDILRRSFDGAVLDESITDECYLVERLDLDIAFVPGNSGNIKITRAEDIALGEALLRTT